MASGTSCDSCNNYMYDEEEDSYFCEINLDEDEMYRFLSCQKFECPHYVSDNEYEVVKHQM